MADKKVLVKKSNQPNNISVSFTSETESDEEGKETTSSSPSSSSSSSDTDSSSSSSSSDESEKETTAGNSKSSADTQKQNGTSGKEPAIKKSSAAESKEAKTNAVNSSKDNELNGKDKSNSTAKNVEDSKGVATKEASLPKVGTGNKIKDQISRLQNDTTAKNVAENSTRSNQVKELASKVEKDKSPAVKEVPVLKPFIPEVRKTVEFSKPQSSSLSFMSFRRNSRAKSPPETEKKPANDVEKEDKTVVKLDEKSSKSEKIDDKKAKEKTESVGKETNIENEVAEKSTKKPVDAEPKTTKKSKKTSPDLTTESGVEEAKRSSESPDRKIEPEKPKKSKKSEKSEKETDSTKDKSVESESAEIKPVKVKKSKSAKTESEKEEKSNASSVKEKSPDLPNLSVSQIEKSPEKFLETKTNEADKSATNAEGVNNEELLDVPEAKVEKKKRSSPSKSPELRVEEPVKGSEKSPEPSTEESTKKSNKTKLDAKETEKEDPKSADVTQKLDPDTISVPEVKEKRKRKKSPKPNSSDDVNPDKTEELPSATLPTKVVQTSTENDIQVNDDKEKLELKNEGSPLREEKSKDQAVDVEKNQPKTSNEESKPENVKPEIVKPEIVKEISVEETKSDVTDSVKLEETPPKVSDSTTTAENTASSAQGNNEPSQETGTISEINKTSEQLQEGDVKNADLSKTEPHVVGSTVPDNPSIVVAPDDNSRTESDGAESDELHQVVKEASKEHLEDVQESKEPIQKDNNSAENNESKLDKTNEAVASAEEPLNVQEKNLSAAPIDENGSSAPTPDNSEEKKSDIQIELPVDVASKSIEAILKSVDSNHLQISESADIGTSLKNVDGSGDGEEDPVWRRKSMDDFIRKILAEARGEHQKNKDDKQETNGDVGEKVREDSHRNKEIAAQREMGEDETFAYDKRRSNPAETRLPEPIRSSDKNGDRFNNYPDDELEAISRYLAKRYDVQQAFDDDSSTGSDASFPNRAKEKRQRRANLEMDYNRYPDDDDIPMKPTLRNRRFESEIDLDDDEREGYMARMRRERRSSVSRPNEDLFVPRKRPETDEAVRERTRNVKQLQNKQTEVVQTLKDSSKKLTELENDIKEAKQMSLDRKACIEDLEEVFDSCYRNFEDELQTALEQLKLQKMPKVQVTKEDLNAMINGVLIHTRGITADKFSGDSILDEAFSFRRRPGSIAAGSAFSIGSGRFKPEESGSRLDDLYNSSPRASRAFRTAPDFGQLDDPQENFGSTKATKSTKTSSFNMDSEPDSFSTTRTAKPSRFSSDFSLTEKKTFPEYSRSDRFKETSSSLSRESLSLGGSSFGFGSSSSYTAPRPRSAATSALSGDAFDMSNTSADDILAKIRAKYAIPAQDPISSFASSYSSEPNTNSFTSSNYNSESRLSRKYNLDDDDTSPESFSGGGKFTSATKSSYSSGASKYSFAPKESYSGASKFLSSSSDQFLSGASKADSSEPFSFTRNRDPTDPSSDSFAGSRNSAVLAKIRSQSQSVTDLSSSAYSSNEGSEFSSRFLAKIRGQKATGAAATDGEQEATTNKSQERPFKSRFLRTTSFDTGKVKVNRGGDTDDRGAESD